MFSDNRIAKPFTGTRHRHVYSPAKRQRHDRPLFRKNCVGSEDVFLRRSCRHMTVISDDEAHLKMAVDRAIERHESIRRKRRRGGGRQEFVRWTTVLDKVAFEIKKWLSHRAISHEARQTVVHSGVKRLRCTATTKPSKVQNKKSPQIVRLRPPMCW